MTKILFTPKDGEGHWLPSAAIVGGKGRGLYWLAHEKFPTPPTWVFSTAAFDRIVEEAGLAEPLAEIEQAATNLSDDWADGLRALNAVEPQRATVVKALEQAGMITQIATELTELPLSPDQWAVRSSATVEDSPQHSFAGQFHSILSVPRKDLWGAMCKVWASNYSREALIYCAQNASPMPRMAIVLQPMEPITANDRSGVAFSHSPAPSLPGVLIQASFGSGQVVVGGRGGDLFGVQGRNVQIQPMPPDHIRVTGPDGDTVPQASPPGLALTEQEAQELGALVSAVAKKWGKPVNVEFVWRAGKKPTLVQVRSVAKSG
jgi:phosphoenolpyruvate synthase/pyruvate phosphate dikinase